MDCRCLCDEVLSVLYGSCHDQKALGILAPTSLIYMKETKKFGGSICIYFGVYTESHFLDYHGRISDL